MRLSTLLLLPLLLLSACASHYEGTHSDWEVFQVGQMCYQQGHGELKFNVPGQLPADKCRCDQLILTKRIVVKAGQSPEALACPVSQTVESYQTQHVGVVTVKAPADNYVPAAGHALSGLFLGTGLGYGLVHQNANRMTQSVTNQYRNSTMYANPTPVPSWLGE
jgi:hypothetical protein